jgi:hypothetical protein
MSDPKFHKYPKIRQLGHEENTGIVSEPEDLIVIEEKIDGGNFRFMLKDGKILFGSRTQSLGYEDDNIGGNWKRCVEYIKEKAKKEGIYPGIYYGECCVKHSIHYNFDDMPPFLGFDVWSFSKEGFLNSKAKTEAFRLLQLPMVPVIWTGSAKDIPKINDEFVPKSQYYEGPAEGVVIKNYSKQLMAKYVTDKFKEVNKKAFGTPKKFAENDDERIVATYCTNARIDKCIFKLIDDGHKLEMKLMHELPHRVIEDIYEEHWRDICFSNFSVNFRQIKKKVSTRCLHVLKQVMVNNALSGGDNE